MVQLKTAGLISNVLIVIVLIKNWNVGNGHSFLLSPKGDFASFKKPECRLGGPPHSPNDNCPGPCINVQSWQYDKNAVLHKYRRGQKVSMSWTRNNHIGGFVHFSLVPKSLRMDKKAHEKMTFRYSCFESDKHLCDVNDCGTDIFLYKTEVEIPTSYPDGEYILGWAWYGGFFKDSYFGDYYSCAHVKIKGGPLTKRYKPYFNPGENVTDSSSCKSTVDRLGICVREPCLGYPAQTMQPFPFSENRTPEPIRRAWMIKEGGNGTTSPSPSAPSPSPSRFPRPSSSPSPPSTTQPPHTSPSPPITSGPDLTPSPANTYARIVGLKMVDTDTEGDVKNIFSGNVFVPSHVINFTFVALTSGDIESVSFYVNDSWIRTEKVVPYSCWGDFNGDFYPWPRPIFGHWVKVKAVAKGRNGRWHNKTFWIRLLRPY